MSRIVPRDFSFRAEFPPVNRALPSKFPDFIDTRKETATRRIGRIVSVRAVLRKKNHHDLPALIFLDRKFFG